MSRGRLTAVFVYLVSLISSAAFAEHATLSGRTVNYSCDKSIYENPYLYYYFEKLPAPATIGGMPAPAEAGSALKLGRSAEFDVDNYRIDTFLLQLYARSLSCPATSLFSRSVAGLLEAIDFSKDLYRLSTNGELEPADRTAFGELVRAMKASAGVLVDASCGQRRELGKWVMSRVSDPQSAKKGPKRLDQRGIDYSTSDLDRLLRSPVLASLIRGETDPAQLFNKQILGLGANAQREIDRKLISPVACQSTLNALRQTPQWIQTCEAPALGRRADERGRVALLYEWFADYLQYCGPSDKVGTALRSLADELCRAGGDWHPKDPLVSEQAQYFCQHLALFGQLKSEGRIAFATQLRAAGRAFRQGVKADAFTPVFEDYLTHLGRGDEVAEPVLAALRQSPQLAPGTPNPQTLYTGLFAISDGRHLALAQEKLQSRGNTTAAIRPSRDRAIWPGQVLDAAYEKIGLRGVDASGQPLPAWWARRKYYFVIDDKRDFGTRQQALDYIVAAAYHPDSIDQTEIVYRELDAYHRILWRRDLIALYADIARGRYPEDLLRRYDNAPAAGLDGARKDYLRAIANLILWLDAPAVAPVVDAAQAKQPYQDFVAAEAAAVQSGKPLLDAAEERALSGGLSIVGGEARAGIPSPLRIRVAQLPLRRKAALLALADEASLSRDPHFPRLAAQAILTGGEPKAAGAMAHALEQANAEHPEAGIAPARRQIVLGLYRGGFATAPPLQTAAYQPVLGTTEPPKRCPPPPAAARTGSAFTEEELVFLASAPSLAPAEIQSWIAASDPIALQSLRCRLEQRDLESPPGFSGSWRDSLAKAADTLRANEAAISRSYLARLQGPLTVPQPSDRQLAGRLVQVGERWVALQSLARTPARDQEETQLLAELKAIRLERGEILPALALSGVDYVRAMQYDPARFAQWTAHLSPAEKQDLAQEILDLKGGGFLTYTGLPPASGADELAYFGAHAEQAVALINAGLPPGDRVHSGIPATVTDGRRREFRRIREAAISRACEPATGNDPARFFAAQAALSDPRADAARNEFRRQVRAGGEPDFGATDDLLGSHIAGKLTLSSGDIDGFLTELAYLPTHEIDRLLATLRRSFSTGTNRSYAVGGLDPPSRQLLLDVVTRYDLARHAPPSYAALARVSFTSPVLFSTSLPSSEESGMADYLYFLSRDARALARSGCPVKVADHLENLRIAVMLRGSGLPQADQVLVHRLWTEPREGVEADVKRLVDTQPESFPNLLVSLENARALLARRGLGDQDPQVERVGRIVAAALVAHFEPKLLALRELMTQAAADLAAAKDAAARGDSAGAAAARARAAEKWKRLAELRDQYLRSNLMPMIAAAALGNDGGKTNVPLVIRDAVKGLLTRYLPEFNLTVALQDRDRAGIYTYVAGGKVVVFKPNPRGESEGMLLEDWKAEADARFAAAVAAIESYEDLSRKAGDVGFLTLFWQGRMAAGDRRSLRTDADEAKAAAYPRALAAIQSLRDLGVPPGDTQQLMAALFQTNQRDSSRIDGRTLRFITSSGAVAALPLSWTLAPTFAGGSLAGRVLMPIAVGTGVGFTAGGIYGVASQRAAIADARANGRPVPPFDWGAVFKSAGVGAGIGAGIGGLSRLPVTQAFVGRALAAWGTADAGSSAAVAFAQGNYYSGSVDATMALFPYAVDGVVKATRPKVTVDHVLSDVESQVTAPLDAKPEVAAKQVETALESYRFAARFLAGVKDPSAAQVARLERLKPLALKHLEAVNEQRRLTGQRPTTLFGDVAPADIKPYHSGPAPAATGPLAGEGPAPLPGAARAPGQGEVVVEGVWRDHEVFTHDGHPSNPTGMPYLAVTGSEMSDIIAVMKHHAEHHSPGVTARYDRAKAAFLRKPSRQSFDSFREALVDLADAARGRPHVNGAFYDEKPVIFGALREASDGAPSAGAAAGVCMAGDCRSNVLTFGLALRDFGAEADAAGIRVQVRLNNSNFVVTPTGQQLTAMYLDLRARGYTGTAEQAATELRNMAVNHSGLHTNTSVSVVTADGRTFRGGVDHHYGLETVAGRDRYSFPQRVTDPNTGKVYEFLYTSDVTRKDVRFPMMRVAAVE